MPGAQPGDLVAEVSRFIGFGPEDAAALASVRDTVLSATQQVVDEFYGAILTEPAAARILESPDQVYRLKQSLARWLEQAFTGPWDAAYEAHRRRIGEVHVRIALPQRYVIAAMNQVQRSLHDIVYGSVPDAEERRRVLTAIHRLLFLDLALMVESYQTSREAEAVHTYEEIVRRTSDVVLTTHPDGRILHANRDCFEISSGRLLEEGIEALRAAQGEASRERFDRAWRAASDGNQAVENVPAEFRAHGAGEAHHCLISFLPDEGEGDRMRVIRAVIRDVTALRNLEADLEQRRRLASVGEMVAGVAHEVRNPLQGVLIGLRRAEQSAADPDALRQAVAHARDGANQIERLITDLLSFSKRLTLSLSNVEAGALLEAALESCRPDFGDRPLPVPVLPPEGEVRLRVDPFRMPQVLRNLIQNAAHATRAGGDVTVEVQVPDAQHVELIVSDGGPGLPEEVRARLFEPFVTTKPGGTGLGLAIARRLVEAHGGVLSFEARPGGGTVARVRVPTEGPATL